MEKEGMFHTKNEGDQWAAGTRMMRKLALFLLPFLILVAAMPLSAAAEETLRKEDWQFGADVYGWMASIGGKTAGGSTIDIPFGQL